jgi:hypothetical protein
LIRPIYRSFLGAAPAGADALTRAYLLPNEAFFRPYVAFMTQGKMGWEDFVREFGKRWGRSPEDLRLLSERMAGQDVEALAGRAVHEATRVLGPEAAEADLYLCVGLEMSNAFMVVVGGEPAIGIGLEAYGRTFGTSHVAFEDLLHVITHEQCHAVRVREALSPLKRFFEAEDAARAFEGVPVRELAVEEGLAVAASLAAVPGLPPHRALFYAPEDYRWCEENAEGLLAEFGAELEEPLAGGRYERYFGSGLEGDDRPPRTGYFLGHALVRRYLDRNPALGLTEAVRLTAEQLLD